MLLGAAVDLGISVTDLLGSALVAAIVSGGLIFTDQQWLQTRIKRIERELERQHDYQQKSHDTLVTAYQRIWAGLVEIEDWLIHRTWQELEGSETVDPQQWTVVFDLYKSFRSEMLFLPDALYDRTLELIHDLEANLNGLLDALRMVIAAKEVDPEGYATDPELLSVVNEALGNVCGDYKSGLESLRSDYQAISRDLLLGSVSLTPKGAASDDEHRPSARAATVD